jgi:hypothetical protein
MKLTRNGRPFHISRSADRFFLVGTSKLHVFPFFPTRKSRRNALEGLMRRIEEHEEVCAALNFAEGL